ncbi:MAG: hypothetical protein C0390_06735 [Syntrophus sp. (in: bacteria)]|nr:hypothetical protein [Syntrophus sp. (in: bacteria)]
MQKRVIICLDGCGPDCLAGSETPNLDALAREGFHAIPIYAYGRGPLSIQPRSNPEVASWLFS